MKNNLRPVAVAALAAFLASATAAAQPSVAAPQAEDSLKSLRDRITAHMTQPQFAAAAWGLKIASLDSGRTLFEHNAGKLLKPASNAKLYTGALALDRLGPDFRIKTSLYATARPNRFGTLHSSLIIYGRGDPSFAARFHNGEYGKILDPLVEALASAGVKRIQGDLIGDESFFHGPPIGSGWAWDDLQYYYGAEVSALTAQDNVVDVVITPGASPGSPCRIATRPATPYLSFINRTETVATDGRRALEFYRPMGENAVYVSGRMSLSETNHNDAVAVRDPARWFLTLFQDALSRRGIRVSGKLRTVNWLERQTNRMDFDKLVELATVESRPLAEIVSRMMKPSQNLYAQLLLLQVAANSPRARAMVPAQTTEAIGLEELNVFLKQAGIDSDEVRLEEGSGLSRGALVTPNATVELLKFMSRHAQAEVFRDALPIAGVDGTLRNRLKDFPAFKNVRAKTGSLRYVNTLSGYLTTAAGERLVFSIMLNNHPAPAGHPAREDLDAIVMMLARFTGRAAKTD